MTSSLHIQHLIAFDILISSLMIFVNVLLPTVSSSILFCIFAFFFDSVSENVQRLTVFLLSIVVINLGGRLAKISAYLQII